MTISELVNQIENFLKAGGVGKCKCGSIEIMQDRRDVKITNHKNDMVYLDILPSIRMSAYLYRNKLAEIGLVDDFNGAPIPTFSELIESARSLERRGMIREFLGEFIIYTGNHIYTIYKKAELVLRIDSGTDIYDFIENVKKKKSELEAIGFIDDLDNPQAKKHDVVNNPSHYKRGEIECYEALKASMTKEQFLGHLKATAIAYLWRYDLKNGLEDVKKAKWYVDKMVEEMEIKK